MNYALTKCNIAGRESNNKSQNYLDKIIAFHACRRCSTFDFEASSKIELLWIIWKENRHAHLVKLRFIWGSFHTAILHNINSCIFLSASLYQVILRFVTFNFCFHSLFSPRLLFLPSLLLLLLAHIATVTAAAILIFFLTNQR